jgi:hypothetical protein
MPAPPTNWKALAFKVVVQLSIKEPELRKRLNVKRAGSPRTI